MRVLACLIEDEYHVGAWFEAPDCQLLSRWRPVKTDQRLWHWNAVLMAIGAADPMDVVSTPGAGEGRVHFLDVDAAVGHLRMAGFAGGGGVLVVSAVAGEAADAFMDADRGAVVPGADLRTPVI